MPNKSQFVSLHFREFLSNKLLMLILKEIPKMNLRQYLVKDIFYARGFTYNVSMCTHIDTIHINVWHTFFRNYMYAIGPLYYREF